jgi:hypothetical protein
MLLLNTADLGFFRSFSHSGSCQGRSSNSSRIIGNQDLDVYTGAISRILADDSLIFCSILGINTVGGYAYAHIPFQSRANASAAISSGYEDTNVGRRLLNLVANRSICGMPQNEQI